jgi:hypothetical protein
MAWIGKKPEFAAKRGTHLVQASCVQSRQYHP